jgi:rod shape determining protein RodA
MLWGFSFQPSELVKLTIIIALARYFSEKDTERELGLGDLIGPVLIVAVPSLLILKQPDLGTALFLVILLMSVVMLFKIRRKLIMLFTGSGIIVIPLFWFFLKDYQRKRILTFLNPELDPLGSGYHIIQSIIAIGSGGMFGKGYLKGTQTQLKFLPEQQTDFVFSVFAEEWGFLGVLILIFLFLALILWGLKIARRSKDMSGMMMAYGVTMYVFWEIFINIGMVLGILPVVGIPLPFMSYGGSSMVVLMMGIGLLINVSIRRFVLQP